MIIRLLTPADVSAYKAFKLYSLSESPFAFSDSYEDESKKSDLDFQRELEIVGLPAESFVLGAFSPLKELIAFVKFKRDVRTKARHKASLHSLYVKPQYRGSGLAKKLLEELFKTIKPLQNLEQIHLWALISDSSVVHFYEKCGFLKQGAIVKNDLKIDGKYVDASYMVKYLN
ncbi:MAG: N-acetyltransferase family protein [Bacteroidia bacterium]